jgi:hypothetical protein
VTTPFVPSAGGHAGYGNLDLPVVILGPTRCGVCRLSMVKAGSTTMRHVLAALDEHITCSEQANRPRTARGTLPELRRSGATVTSLDALRQHFSGTRSR